MGAGCDKDLKTVEESCEIAPSVEAKLINNQISLGQDYPSIEVYSTRTGPPSLINTQVSFFGGTISCMDGQVISWRKNVYGNLEAKKCKPAAD